MISIEALVNVLIAKGIGTKDEIINEIKRLKQIDHDLRQGKSEVQKDGDMAGRF